MARDKAKDDLMFNCGQEYELTHVLNQYPSNQRDEVKKIVEKACADGFFSNSTHEFVYTYVDEKLKA